MSSPSPRRPYLVLLLVVVALDQLTKWLVDRSMEPQHAHVVIAVVEGEFVCRRLITQEGLCLRASDPAVADVIPGDGEEDLRVWGVVTTVVKSLPV